MKLLNNWKQKYRNIARPARASIWFVICYIIQRGLQFISMPVYTRIMSQKEYGVYSVFLSWFNVICVFTSMNIYSGTFNKAMVKYEDQRNQYISSVQMLTTVITLFFSIITMIFKRQVIKITGLNDKTLLLMFIHLLFFPTLQYWSQELRFRYEYRTLVIVTAFNAIFSTSLGILAVIFAQDKSTALIFTVVAVQAIICIILYISILRKGKCLYHKDYWKWSIGLAVPLIPHYISEILLGHSDRLMIDQMCGSAKAGIYNIVYQISMVMTIIRTGINGAFAPWLYYSIKNRQYHLIKSVTRVLTVMMFLMSVAFMVIGPEILKIVAPESYYEAVVDIPAIMTGGFFIFIYILFVFVETYYEEKEYVSVASISATVLNITLNWIFIRRYGYLVAGYTTMISYMVMAIIHFIFLHKIAKKYSEIKELFDNKFIFGIAAVLVCAGGICLKLYHYFWVRYMVILAVLIITFMKRSIFIELLKEMKDR